MRTVPFRAVTGPTPVDVYFDYHCPYSHRAVEWLARLGPDRVTPRYRFFPLEQVNRDPEAADWRLWEQPLDYEHYGGRQDRRSLAPFLATAHLEATEAPDVVERFRVALYGARFDGGADVSDPAVLFGSAVQAGADVDRLRARWTDPSADAAARVRIATDWTAARSEFAIFGVPTLVLARASRPYYLRVERHLEADEGIDLWGRLTALVTVAPYLLELKAADRLAPVGPGGADFQPG